MVVDAKHAVALHVIVQGKHLDITPALRDYAETKVGKIAYRPGRGQTEEAD